MMANLPSPEIKKGTVKSKDKPVLPNIGTIALVHEWLSLKAGSEEVLQSFVEIFQDVDLYATVDFMSAADREKIAGPREINTSFIQRLPFARRHFRYYLPLMPWAVRRHQLKQYSLVLSSSHAFAHGLKKAPGQVHISYCHTPMRYIWDMQDVYLKSHGIHAGPLGWASKLLTALLRAWDARVSGATDHYIANSRFTAQRIRRFYGRKATVIHPPVAVEKFSVEEQKGDYYLTVARMVCYKKVDLVVKAFNAMPLKKLIVIGDGSEKEKVELIAGPNVTILSHLEFAQFHKYLREAKAFVFAGKEDFGITLVEAQACGTPLIAFHKGGASEIIQPGKTGLFFRKQTPTAIAQAVEDFEQNYHGKFSAHQIRLNAERFGYERFKREVLEYVQNIFSGRHAQ